MIKPNYHEALRLVGRERNAPSEEMEAVCHEVRGRTGAQDVVITAGAKGMYVLSGESFTHLLGMPREVAGGCCVHTIDRPRRCELLAVDQ